ncbi:BON domain-containing protein [Alkaliphilus serpentinus]|uniref:BON domain-containing protein n=1 Tax=Alkaliphilus serpentinus TaxID=1482731 RepID=A0A833HMV3_9FIRM|nr:BON domain-containing protein [Alkaliphilus serpentinus]KAB3527183.1 BON domain-containing protein [Alkaliphilus serpentinus]
MVNNGEYKFNSSNGDINDKDLSHAIKSNLEAVMQASAMDINVYCRDGVVQLTGIVDLLAEKKQAEDIVKSFSVTKKVENNLTIAMDSNITDKHIQKEVMNKLTTGENEAVRGVGVKVDDGVVTLMGRINNLKEVHTAMDMASENRGVKDVVNKIEIDSLGSYTDAAINNKILQELSQTDLSYRDVHRKVSDGVVTLFGYLDNSKEIELAKEIALGVEGVKKVINKLKTRVTK